MRSKRNVLLAVYVAVSLFALTWPGYAIFGNSIEPFILGVPFSFAWVVGWVLLMFAVLVVYHVTGSFVDEDAGKAGDAGEG